MSSKIDHLCIIIVFISFIVPKVVTYEENRYYEIVVSLDHKKEQSLWFDLEKTTMTYSSEEANELFGKEYDKYEQRLMQNLSFNFPYYGHPIRSLRIDRNGFLEVGKSQLIAPLKHNFIDYHSNYSFIYCFNNDSHLTVSWESSISDSCNSFNSSVKYKYYLFQVTLNKTGDIAFVYEHFTDQIIIKKNHSDEFTIGLSDAYMMNGTLHEYDRVSVPTPSDERFSFVYFTVKFTPRPTCLDHKNCSSCLSHTSTSHLTCYWCPTAKLCSTGEDWYHPIWVKNNCYKEAIKKYQSCSMEKLPRRTTPPSEPTIGVLAPPTQNLLDTSMIVVIVFVTFILQIGCIGIVVLIVRRRLMETGTTERTQSSEVIAETTPPNTAQAIKMTQWTKRVSITIEAQTTPGSENSFAMPVVKIEKQKRNTIQLASDVMDMAEYDIIPDKHWEFPRQSLCLGESLGEGAFGRVVRAEAKGIMTPGTVTTVAVKMLREDHLDSEMIALVSEMEIMKMIGRHVNIINLLGVCSQHGPLYVIVEFAKNNNLKHFLRKYRPSTEYNNMVFSDSNQVNLSEEDLVSFAHQVANGMQYLHSRKCLHRDLAARNVLVCQNFIMKIADFGLARDVQVKEYYRVDSQPLLPYKWMAPESLSHRLFKYESDVWSYGVLLWEIMTFGEAPYPSICDKETMVSFLRHGHRLEKPSHCAGEIYDMMQECWKHEASDRPQFGQLVSKLHNILANK